MAEPAGKFSPSQENVNSLWPWQFQQPEPPNEIKLIANLLETLGILGRRNMFSYLFGGSHNLHKWIWNCLRKYQSSKPWTLYGMASLGTSHKAFLRRVVDPIIKLESQPLMKCLSSATVRPKHMEFMFQSTAWTCGITEAAIIAMAARCPMVFSLKLWSTSWPWYRVN